MTPDELRIETAVPADLPQVKTLLGSCGLPLDGLEACFGTAVVARTNQGVAGCAALEQYGGCGLLRSVAVAEIWRKNGLGRALVLAAFRRAAAAGITQLYLLTETAVPFFSRLGFRLIPRKMVPGEVQASIEFTTACPASAQAMVLILSPWELEAGDLSLP